ncbi:hypothetical protein QFC24_003728 [Naganishia onofrii]|uniref:Uncharacterized protein n=1 Tax=Naganishia onofrii TaxID=1851511 RepID=A0ACC2XJD7_9TREE|nr:hypothetical protein QFC24_003728 [Naganishia onofrii]
MPLDVLHEHLAVNAGSPLSRSQQNSLSPTHTAPSAFSSLLKTAKPVEDIRATTYSSNISPPSPSLNQLDPPGKFRYDRAFLLQFSPLCKDRLDVPMPLDMFGIDPRNPPISRISSSRTELQRDWSRGHRSTRGGTGNVSNDDTDDVGRRSSPYTTLNEDGSSPGRWWEARIQRREQRPQQTSRREQNDVKWWEVAESTWTMPSSNRANHSVTSNDPEWTTDTRRASRVMLDRDYGYGGGTTRPQDSAISAAPGVTQIASGRVLSNMREPNALTSVGVNASPQTMSDLDYGRGGQQSNLRNPAIFAPTAVTQIPSRRISSDMKELDASAGGDDSIHAAKVAGYAPPPRTMLQLDPHSTFQCHRSPAATSTKTPWATATSLPGTMCAQVSPQTLHSGQNASYAAGYNTQDPRGFSSLQSSPYYSFDARPNGIYAAFNAQPALNPLTGLSLPEPQTSQSLGYQATGGYLARVASQASQAQEAVPHKEESISQTPHMSGFTQSSPYSSSIGQQNGIYSTYNSQPALDASAAAFPLHRQTNQPLGREEIGARLPQERLEKKQRNPLGLGFVPGSLARQPAAPSILDLSTSATDQPPSLPTLDSRGDTDNRDKVPPAPATSRPTTPDGKITQARRLITEATPKLTETANDTSPVLVPATAGGTSSIVRAEFPSQRELTIPDFENLKTKKITEQHNEFEKEKEEKQRIKREAQRKKRAQKKLEREEDYELMCFLLAPEEPRPAETNQEQKDREPSQQEEIDRPVQRRKESDAKEEKRQLEQLLERQLVIEHEQRLSTQRDNERLERLQKDTDETEQLRNQEQKNREQREQEEIRRTVQKRKESDAREEKRRLEQLLERELVIEQEQRLATQRESERQDRLQKDADEETQQSEFHYMVAICLLPLVLYCLISLCLLLFSLPTM